MKILICEDDIITLRAIETKLKREGYETITAPDGSIAEEIIRNNDFDIFITDLLMPYTTGLELVYLIRYELKLDKPIIAVTSIGLEDTVIKTFKLGVDDYVVKPFSLNELAFRIKLCLKLRNKMKERNSKLKKTSAIRPKLTNNQKTIKKTPKKKK